MARMHSFSGLLLMLIIGLGFTVLGGYAAGRTAKRAELLNGAAVAALGIILDFPSATPEARFGMKSSAF